MKSPSDYEPVTADGEMYDVVDDERWKVPGNSKLSREPEAEGLMERSETPLPAQHNLTRMLLQLVLLVLVLVLIMQTYILWRWHHEKDAGFPWTSPRNIRPTEFVDDQNFQNMHHEYDHYWAALFPPSMGVTQLPGEDKENGISMFHQLHCLRAFRQTIQDLQDGKHVGYASGHELGAHQGHWPHCFDYMRQVLLCHADDTRVQRDSNGQFSGLDFTRNCRDHEALYKQAYDYAWQGPLTDSVALRQRTVDK